MHFKTKNRLVVEGPDDLFSVVGLMRAHAPWPQNKFDAPVRIEIGKSAEEILDRDYISTHLKASDVDALGFMLDADKKTPQSRYDRIRAVCSTAFPSLPVDLPDGGLVAANADGKRLGVWVMPDNSADGCLETFLRYLVPNELEPLWQHASEVTNRSREIGATWRDAHKDKAVLYTWLAWHDPPGQNPGVALTQKILNPHSPSAAIFVRWFKDLYQLQ